GASSGIGYEAAKRFAQRGKNIIAVARSKEKLENLKNEILGTDNASAEVIIKAYDLTQKENIYAVYNSVKDLDIEAWINNAGFGDYCSVGNQTLTKMEDMLSLNIE
ncbi:SDR family NAD(P)-dependent oxidoreductase, partial [Treponema pedis]